PREREDGDARYGPDHITVYHDQGAPVGHRNELDVPWLLVYPHGRRRSGLVEQRDNRPAQVAMHATQAVDGVLRKRDADSSARSTEFGWPAAALRGLGHMSAHWVFSARTAIRTRGNESALGGLVSSIIPCLLSN